MLSLFFACICTYTQATEASIYTKSSQDTVKVGLYVSKVFDIDYSKGSYKVAFTIFTNSYTLMYDLDSYFDIHDAIGYENGFSYYDSTRTVNGRQCYWSSFGSVVEIAKDFNISRFPFDKDTLNINLELNYSYKQDLVVVLDTSNTVLKQFRIRDWIISDTKIILNESNFRSTFGDPNISDTSTKYNLIQATYLIERESFLIFIKLFTALFLSFILGLCSLLLGDSKLDAKLALIVGGVFGAIGNKYITESMLPLSNTFTLSDKLHDLTLLFLVVMTIYAIARQRRKPLKNVLNPIPSLFVLFFSYLIIVILLLP